MRLLTTALALALGGCATSLSGIREKPAIETVISGRTPDEIERCIVQSQPGGRIPVTISEGTTRELTIVQDSAGAVMHFTLRPVETGTEVTFRRKGALVNYDDQARACYLTAVTEDAGRS